VHTLILIIHVLPIFWHHVHSKKDHKKLNIFAHSSSRTRENTNKSISPRNETKPRPIQKHPRKPQWLE